MIPGTARLGLACCLAVLIQACGPAEEAKGGKYPVLAEVYDQKLRLSELETGWPSKSGEDSILHIRSLTDRWIRESLLFREAEAHTSSSGEIERLVADYRRSLLLDSYEGHLMDAGADTLLKNEDLRSYYQEHAQEFTSTEDLLQADLVSLPAKIDARRLKALQADWEKQGAAPTKQFEQDLSAAGGNYLSRQSSWVTASALGALLPPETWNRNISRQSRRYTHGGRIYWLKITESLEAGRQMPFEYAEAQLRKILRHRRQRNILEQEQERLYQAALKEGHIKVY